MRVSHSVGGNRVAEPVDGGCQNLPRPALKPLHAVALKLGKAHHQVFARLALKLSVKRLLCLVFGEPRHLGELARAISQKSVCALFNGFDLFNTALYSLKLALELTLFFIERLLAFKDPLLGAGHLVLLFFEFSLGLDEYFLALLFRGRSYLLCLLASVEEYLFYLN